MQQEGCSCCLPFQVELTPVAAAQCSSYAVLSLKYDGFHASISSGLLHRSMGLTGAVHHIQLGHPHAFLSPCPQQESSSFS